MHGVQLVIVSGKWSPGVGDPTVLGWLLTGGYVLAAVLCARLAAPGNRGGGPHAPRFWYITAAILVLLGVNKQLDLQTLLWQTGRALAKSQGWYEHRRLVQYAFLGFMAILGVATLRVLVRSVRPARVEHHIVVTGMAMLLYYILLRVVSIHPIDRALGTVLFGISLKNAIESVGILTVCAGAIKAGLAAPDTGALPHPKQ